MWSVALFTYVFHVQSNVFLISQLVTTKLEISNSTVGINVNCRIPKIITAAPCYSHDQCPDTAPFCSVALCFNPPCEGKCTECSMCHNYKGVPCGTGIDQHCGSRCSAELGKPYNMGCPKQLVRKRFSCSVTCLNTCNITTANNHEFAFDIKRVNTNTLGSGL